MDGNSRWSKKNSLNNDDGYYYGANKLISMSKFIFKNYDVNHISAFALSKNNLNRPKTIIKIIKKVLKKSLLDLENQKLQFDIEFIGDFKFLNKEIKNRIVDLNKKKHFKKKLIIFLNYSGKDEIINASKISNKNKKTFKTNLLTNNLPDPDILIRTGGYSRLSNFMLFQMAFTELFFIKKLWPDINSTDIRRIISKYHMIDRKFGL